MINRSMQPRQMYGLGSLVKKAVKGVKSVIKSPIGKAAILGAVGFGIPGTNIGGLFGRAAFGGQATGALGSAGIGQFLMGTPRVPDAIGKTGFLDKIGLSGLSTAKKAFLGGSAALTLASMFPQQEGEDDDTYTDRLKRLEPLMDRYYKNVNPNASADEVKDFILKNTQEYRAMGGRVGYRFGGDTMEKEGIKSLEAGAPDVKYSGDMRLASESGPEEFEMDLMSELIQAFEEAKKQGFQGDFKSFLDMYMGSQAQAPEGIMQEAPNIRMASNDQNTALLERLYEDFLEMGLSPEAAADAARREMENMQDDFTSAPEGIRSTMAANGGRVGLMKGAMPLEEDDEEDSYRAGVMQAMAADRKKAMGGGMMEIPTGIIRMNQGGIMERDYRDEGGFVPVGIKEKADDVPAMLSKNEFVMTADAVRAAGGGSVQKGAQKMYDTMKSLERKVV